MLVVAGAKFGDSCGRRPRTHPTSWRAGRDRWFRFVTVARSFVGCNKRSASHNSPINHHRPSASNGVMRLRLLHPTDFHRTLQTGIGMRQPVPDSRPKSRRVVIQDSDKRQRSISRYAAAPEPRPACGAEFASACSVPAPVAASATVRRPGRQRARPGRSSGFRPARAARSGRFPAHSHNPRRSARQRRTAPPAASSRLRPSGGK